MVKPSNFILTTDYATLKNDATGSISFVIPGSISIPASGTYSYTSTHTISLGSIGASLRSSINSSASPTLWFNTPSLSIAADGTDSVIGAVVYSYFVYITRTDATTLTVNVLIPNNAFGAATLTTEPTARTIIVQLNTFIPPFA